MNATSPRDGSGSRKRQSTRRDAWSITSGEVFAPDLTVAFSLRAIIDTLNQLSRPLRGMIKFKRQQKRVDEQKAPYSPKNLRTIGTRSNSGNVAATLSDLRLRPTTSRDASTASARPT